MEGEPVRLEGSLNVSPISTNIELPLPLKILPLPEEKPVHRSTAISFLLCSDELLVRV